MKQQPHSDEVYFTINEVAGQVGVVPATIRNWEKQGLFTPRRSASGYRIFTFADIERLKLIRQRSKDENMGINAIRLLYAGNEALQKKEVGVSKKLLSKKWKEYRLQHGYLLEDVAQAIGISPSYLSKIENVQANVSLDILRRLAEFYGENLLYYINGSEEESHLVRKNEGEEFSIGIPGITIRSVVALQHNTISTMIYTVEPGAGRDSASAHSGEEYIYLLAGKIDFFLGDEKYVLNAGDSLCFRSQKPHLWVNAGKKTAKILWVYTPEVKSE